MTTSELAERKKELTECYTVEELADMYLESEKQRTAERETAAAQVAELLAEIDEEKRKHAAIIAEGECAVRSSRIMNEHNEALASHLVKANKEIQGLENALDVVMRRYVKLTEDK